MKLTSIFETASDELGSHGPRIIVGEGLGQISISEGLQYHINNDLPIHDSIYRPQSMLFLKLFAEVRSLYDRKQIQICENDQYYFDNTDIGKFEVYNGNSVPLDLPLTDDFLDVVIREDEKKNPELNKPKRGGTKKFYVYVKDPQSGNIKKVSFGMAGGGLRAKLNNPEARRAFSKRHDCPNKKDKTKPSYWSCRLPRYAKLLGLKTTFTGYW